MSIEKLIETLTAAVVDLNATLKAANLGVPVAPETKQPDPGTGALGKRKPADKAPAAATEADVSANAATTKSTETSPSETPALTKDIVKAKVVKLIGVKSKDVALALLKGFGADHLDKVKPEDYADLVAKCDQILAGELP